MTGARLGDPATVIAALKPSPIDNTATNTMTTPAIPTIATTDEPSRWGIFRMPSDVTAMVWAIQPSTSVPPQRVGHPQPHRRRGRQRPGQRTEQEAEAHADHHVATSQKEHG